ncbi:MAG TPA: hypothetical protein VMF31_03130 [Solirubrobacterales bacterium]|nr:hypothetical protein [Solirubrobacterales bacterium]
MSVVVWITVGLALWHFTIFVPERFWQGIVGALLGCVFGAMVSGAIILLLMGDGLNDTNFITFLAAIPGTVAGAALVYWIGERSGEPELEL